MTKLLSAIQQLTFWPTLYSTDWDTQQIGNFLKRGNNDLSYSVQKHCKVRRIVSTIKIKDKAAFISERELMFMFAICRRPSVCLSVCRLPVCLSVVCLSVCLSVCRL